MNHLPPHLRDIAREEQEAELARSELQQRVRKIVEDRHRQLFEAATKGVKRNER